MEEPSVVEKDRIEELDMLMDKIIQWHFIYQPISDGSAQQLASLAGSFASQLADNLSTDDMPIVLRNIFKMERIAMQVANHLRQRGIAGPGTELLMVYLVQNLSTEIGLKLAPTAQVRRRKSLVINSPERLLAEMKKTISPILMANRMQGAVDYTTLRHVTRSFAKALADKLDTEDMPFVLQNIALTTEIGNDAIVFLQDYLPRGSLSMRNLRMFIYDLVRDLTGEIGARL